VQAVLGPPPRIVPVGIIVVGYSDEPPQSRPWRPLSEIIHYDRYTPAYGLGTASPSVSAISWESAHASGVVV